MPRSAASRKLKPAPATYSPPSDCADAGLEKPAACANVSARHHKCSLPDANMQNLLVDRT
jgi:hypothetical protein